MNLLYLTANVCPVAKGQIVDEYGNCVCPPGSAKDETEVCIPCRKQSGMIINDEGYCVCALENGMIIDEYGRCVCPIHHGYRLDANGYCKLGMKRMLYNKYYFDKYSCLPKFCLINETYL